MREHSIISIQSVFLPAAFAVYVIPTNFFETPAVIPAIQFSLLLILLMHMQIPLASSLPGILYGGMMLALTAMAIVIDWRRVDYRDLFEIPKYIFIAMAFVSGASLYNYDKNIIKKTLYGFSAILIVFGFLNVLLYEYYPDIVGIYVRENAVLGGKPVIFFWTTYFAASVYLLFACITLGRIISSQAFKGDHIIFVLLCTLAILTQSRSGFLALLVLLGIYFFTVSYKNKYFLICFVIFLASAIIFTPESIYKTALEEFSYLSNGINKYIFNFYDSFEGNNSLGKRIDQLNWVLSENNLVFIGSGIGKGYREYLESWFALFYYRYGVFGIIIYVLIWNFPMIYMLMRRVVNGVVIPEDIIVGLSLFLLILPILSISSVITDQITMCMIFYMFLGACYASIFERKTA